MSFPTPRPFQTKAHEELRKGAREHRKQVVMAPTGAGKAFLGLRVCNEAAEKGRRAVMIADRKALIHQLSESAYNYGMRNYGVIMGDEFEMYDPSKPVQICSVQTIQARTFPEADVYVVDETHTLMPGWTEQIEKSNAMWIGLSATPFTRGLGKLYSNLINATTMSELVKQEFLVPMRVISCVKPNMEGAATSGGEWTAKAAGERGMQIVGDVVKEWFKHADNGKTIVFGSDIKHCESLCQQFNDAGVFASLYTSKTPDRERKQILSEYRKPDSIVRVLISVEALAKGFDVPDVTFVVDARPLRKSLSTAIQMWGRGARSSPETGKTCFTLLDCSGNYLRFAQDFENIYHNGLEKLDDGELLDRRIRDEQKEEKEAKSCPKCGFHPFFKSCMSCGFENRSDSMTEHADGVGVEVRSLAKVKADFQTRQRFYSELVFIQKQKGYSEGWIGHKYQEKFGVWPRGLSRTPAAPSDETRNWVKSRNIRYAKGKQKQLRIEQDRAVSQFFGGQA